MDLEKEILNGEKIETIIDKSNYISQAEALVKLINRENAFLTGLAGTGKTYVIKKWIKIMKEINPDYNIVLSSTTGISALLIEGTTIHSVTGMNASRLNFNEKLKAQAFSKKLLNQIKNIDCLVIDEVSMLSEWQLKFVYDLFKYVKKEDIKNTQFVISGDFTQLKPVAKNNENKVFKNFCYETPAWKEIGFNDIYLDRVYRARDYKLNKFLTKLAGGKANYEDIKDMNFVNIDDNNDAPIIVSTNKKKEEIDKYKQALNPSTVIYDISPELPKLEDGYSQSFIDSSKDYLSELKLNEMVSIKKGDMVMIRVNEPNNEKDSYAIHLGDNSPKLKNGMVGTIEHIEVISKDNFYLIFKYQHKENNGKITDHYYKIFKKYEFKNYEIIETKDDKKEELTALVFAIPLTLAYAITTHKSQGQTYEKIVADLSNMWQENLGYVTLSRATSFDNISILIGESSRFNNLNEFISKNAFSISQDSLDIRKKVLHNSTPGDRGSRMVKLYNDIRDIVEIYNLKKGDNKTNEK